MLNSKYQTAITSWEKQLQTNPILQSSTQNDLFIFFPSFSPHILEFAEDIFITFRES